MRTSMRLLFACAAAATSVVAGRSEFRRQEGNWTVGQTVQTGSGPVSGHPASNDSAVSEYLGIPFAAAPVGDLRFAAPVKFNGTAALNGTKFGYSCPVKTSTTTTYTAANISSSNITAGGLAALTVLSSAGAVFSEDCLYLNVWTKPQVGDTKKAVLLFIYGGGFTSGTSTTAGYNGANIVDQEDVIVVTFNYRTNVLGFPGNPAGPNNLGLLDQRMAVEWVRDNIANFGGDASRITLFGQSAGGASVDFYSYAWADDPIVAGFIPESGTAFSWGLPNAADAAKASWFEVASKLDCGDAKSNETEVVTCMRGKGAVEILDAVPASSGATGILGLFSPTIDNTVVFSNYANRTAAAAPLLIGNNDYEGGLFRTEFALSGTIYPDSFWTAFNLQEFTCPAGVRANASLAAGNPTWRYRYMGVFPDTALSSESGAYHAAELAVLFNTQSAGIAATPEEIAIGSYMRGAWAAFAKDPTNGLNTYGWPAYEVGKQTLVRLGYNNETGTNEVDPVMYDAECTYVNISSTATPTLPAGGSSSSASATASGTGAASATSTKTGGGEMVRAGGWMALAAGVMIWVL